MESAEPRPGSDPPGPRAPTLPRWCRRLTILLPALVLVGYLGGYGVMRASGSFLLVTSEWKSSGVVHREYDIRHLEQMRGSSTDWDSGSVDRFVSGLYRPLRWLEGKVRTQMGEG